MSVVIGLGKASVAQYAGFVGLTRSTNPHNIIFTKGMLADSSGHRFARLFEGFQGGGGGRGRWLSGENAHEIAREWRSAYQSGFGLFQTLHIVQHATQNGVSAGRRNDRRRDGGDGGGWIGDRHH